MSARATLGWVLVALVTFVVGGCFPLIVRSSDRSLLDIGRAAADAPPATDSVWPGYSLLEQGFLLYRPGGPALLVTSEDPPDGFEAVEDEDLPPGLRGRAYRSARSLPGLDGGVVPAYRVDGIETTAVPATAPFRSTLATLYHEAFHRHQRGSFETAGVGNVVAAGLLTREFVAMVEVERRILARALALDPGDEEVDSLVARFLAVRHERLRGLPERVREVERALERREGTAHLVGFESIALALGEGRDEVLDAVRIALDWRLEQFGGDRGTQTMHWRAYGTGAAMGVLLDREEVAWRERLEGGAALDGLLAAAIDFDPASASASATQALEDFDYDDILVRTEATRTADEVLEEFYGLAPVRLVIEARPTDPTTYDAPLSFNFSPGARGRVEGRRTGMSRPRPGLTLVWTPELLQAIEPARAGFDLWVRERPVAVHAGPEGAGDTVGRTLVVLLPRTPRVRGRRTDVESPSHPDGIEVDGPGIRFHTDLPATLLSESSDSIHVRITP